jgi:hypothetical protein
MSQLKPSKVLRLDDGLTVGVGCKSVLIFWLNAWSLNFSLSDCGFWAVECNGNVLGFDGSELVG